MSGVSDKEESHPDQRVDVDVAPEEVSIAGGCIHDPQPNSEPGGCAECRKALAERLMMA